jgi:hypothetical protein
MGKLCMALMVTGGLLGYTGYAAGNQNLMFIGALIGLSGGAGLDRMLRAF